MATIEQALGPPSRLARFRSDSRPSALALAATGGASLLIVVGGPLAVLWSRGLTPVPSLVAGIESGTFATVLAVGIVVGALAVAGGFGSYRSMPTKVAREEAIAGAVLGLQAIVVGALVLWFRNGDVEVFARNFLDFERLPPHAGTFVGAARNTLFLAFGSEAIGIGLGLLFALFVSSKRSVVRAPARVYINFFRGTPLLWQLSFLSLVIFTGFKLNFSTYTVGIIILALNAGGYTAEVFRAGIQSIERGQLDAARGLGMSYMQAMRYAVVPQAIRRVIPPLMNEFVILIKDTSLIAAALGVTQAERELMKTGSALYASSFNASYFLATALGYLAVTLPLIRIVNIAERRLRSGLVGVTGA